MLNTIILYGLPLSFTLLATCFLTCVASGLMLFLFRLRSTNQALRHPYLDKQPWERFPFSIKATILLDYFLRLSFPRKKFWIIGDANRLLAHVDPSEVSSRIKWPLIGFWGGCFVGLAAMLALWIFILLANAI